VKNPKSFHLAELMAQDGTFAELVS